MLNIKRLLKNIDYKLDLITLDILKTKYELINKFVWLQNQPIGYSMPFNYAKEIGFVQPVFAIETVKKLDWWTDEEYKHYKQTMESVWIKEGISV